MKYFLFSIMLVLTADAMQPYELSCFKVTMPSDRIIKSKLSKDENFKDLTIKSELHKQLSEKILTYRELNSIVARAIEQWAEYHNNGMILLFADQTVPLVVKTIFKNKPTLIQSYERFLTIEKELKEVSRYLV